MSNLLGIFAKQPVAGQVKTRLAAATSPEWAVRVARAFLEDTLDRCRHVPCSRAIVYAPDEARDFFAELAGERYDLIAQAEGDLGNRLQAFFTDARRQDFAKIIAIGTDSPTLPLAWIDDAFRLLDDHDVVLGPALDGGYYLIGCAKDVALFDNIPWSTARVLETTVARVRAADARLALLPPWYDVDTADDWVFLRGHVLALRQVDLDPGVPRVEQLIVQERSEPS